MFRPFGTDRGLTWGDQSHALTRACLGWGTLRKRCRLLHVRPDIERASTFVFSNERCFTALVGGNQWVHLNQTMLVNTYVGAFTLTAKELNAAKARGSLTIIARQWSVLAYYRACRQLVLNIMEPPLRCLKARKGGTTGNGSRLSLLSQKLSSFYSG